MKVGLCTPYKIDNYGTKLQAYAVQEKIRGMGYDAEIVNFERKSDLRPIKLFLRYCNITFLRTKFKKRKNQKIAIGQGIDKTKLRIRQDAINSFDRTHYTTTPPIKGYKNLCKISKKYVAIVCGSDQIWLPSSINNPTVTLEFAPIDCRKIAFSPSFGISNLPKTKRAQYKRFLERMDFLSVREVQGASIIEELIGEKPTVTLDPTLTVNLNVWEELAKEGRELVKGDYIFCYFLGENIRHRQVVHDLAEKEGLQIVSLPHFKKYVEADVEYSDIQLYEVTPSDFIRLIKEAKIICTDSFHGTIFSVLYHKAFYTFERFKADDMNSANSRIHSLMDKLDLMDYVLTEDNNYAITVKKPDYQAVDSKLSELKRGTERYLKEAFAGIPIIKESAPTFELPQNNRCCGCSACATVCPNRCIELLKEEETGFSYPQLENQEKCINCNLCNSVCPVKKQMNTIRSIKEAYYVINNQVEIRKASASGGVFYPVAKRIIEEGGSVSGARYDEHFNVQHVLVNTVEELWPLVGSKYSESALGTVFFQIKEQLDTGTRVLFSGTPCQVHGLKGYLQKEYSNLLTLDLLCYGIQSPKAWNSYKEHITKKKSEISTINMRDKTDSWQKYSMKIEFSNGEIYLKSKLKDPYLRSYSKGLYIRPACYSCTLKNEPRKSDLTIGDFWDIDKLMPEKNDGNGASIVLINTQQGRELIEELTSREILTICKIPIEDLQEVHPLFGVNAKKHKKSRKFFSLLLHGDDFGKIVRSCEYSKAYIVARKMYRKIKNK